MKSYTEQWKARKLDDASHFVILWLCLFTVSSLEANSERFTNAERSLQVYVWRRNSLLWLIERNEKMWSARSKWWIVSNIRKSFSFTMHSNTTKWSALFWNCESDEPFIWLRSRISFSHFCPAESMAASCSTEFSTINSFSQKKLVQSLCGKSAKQWTTFTSKESFIWTSK